MVSQGTSEAAGLGDRDKGSWLATICGGPGVALAAGPVDRDDSDKGRSWLAMTGGARAAGPVSQPEEASESAGPVRIRSGPVGGPNKDGSAEGSRFKLAQAESDPVDQTEHTGRPHPRVRRSALARPHPRMSAGGGPT